MRKEDEEKGGGSSKGSTSHERNSTGESIGRIDDWFKAKTSVGESTELETEEKDKVFRSSSKQPRTPRKILEDSRILKELLAELKKLREEIKEDREKLREEIKEDREEIRGEIRKSREEFKEREEIMRKEWMEMREKVKELEKKVKRLICCTLYYVILYYCYII